MGFDVTDVLSRGLSAARTRVNVLAANIANAETTRTPEGGPYQRRDVVQVATTAQSSFSSVLDQMTLAAPQVERVVADQSPGRMVFQPGHPDANKDGFVEYPNINVVSTMTDLTSASALYQANVAALQTARQMSDAARNIGNNQ